MDIAPAFVPTAERVAELDRPGDEIAVLSAHLEAATARPRDRFYREARRASAECADPVSEAPTMAQQQADALALLAESAAPGLDPGTAGERYQVVVHVDAPVLADPDQPGQSLLEDGARVPAETSRRLARREPRGHAARRRRANPGNGGAYPDDSAGPAARATAPRPRLSCSGVPNAAHAGPSPAALG